MTVPQLLAAAVTYTDLFRDLSGTEQFALLCVLIGCATLTVITSVGIVAGVMYFNRRREEEMELRRDLLDQGKSAEEIERILHPADPWARAVGGWFGSQDTK